MVASWSYKVTTKFKWILHFVVMLCKQNAADIQMSLQTGDIEL